MEDFVKIRKGVLDEIREAVKYISVKSSKSYPGDVSEKHYGEILRIAESFTKKDKAIMIQMLKYYKGINWDDFLRGFKGSWTNIGSEDVCSSELVSYYYFNVGATFK